MSSRSLSDIAGVGEGVGTGLGGRFGPAGAARAGAAPSEIRRKRRLAAVLKGGLSH
jgi:hypothetical protein